MYGPLQRWPWLQPLYQMLDAKGGFWQAKEKGVLSERSLVKKWKNITGNSPGESELDVEVTDGDVDFIVHNCDKNGDGAINRDEIFATISVWMGLLIDQKRRDEAQAAAAKKRNPIIEVPAFATPGAGSPASGACSIMPWCREWGLVHP